MKKGAKLWLVVAVLLIVFGAATVACAAYAQGWDFTKFSTVNYQTNTYEGLADFDDISIETDTADIFILPSEDETCKVVCFEQEKVTHTVAVENGVLSIEVIDEREWYDYIGISLRRTKIDVYLPKVEYGALFIEESTGDIEIPDNFTFKSIDISVSTGDVKNRASTSGDVNIKTSTGDIYVEDIKSNALNLSASTGKVTALKVICDDMTVGVSTGESYLSDVLCESLVSTGSTGDIVLKNVIATESFSIERSTGDVEFESCDAGEITVTTSTGDVKGTLLSEKKFITDSNTGSVEVPKDGEGGKCEITTSTGDIKITIKNK